MLGVKPDDYTAAELWFGYLARARLQWGQTSTLCCLIANANRDPKRKARPFTPSDFNPLVDRREYAGGSGGIPINRDTMGAVALAWTGKRFGEGAKPQPLNLPEIKRRKHG